MIDNYLDKLVTMKSKDRRDPCMSYWIGHGTGKIRIFTIYSDIFREGEFNKRKKQSE